jgi:hypothetical protein
VRRIAVAASATTATVPTMAAVVASTISITAAVSTQIGTGVTSTVATAIRAWRRGGDGMEARRWYTLLHRCYMSSGNLTL